MVSFSQLGSVQNIPFVGSIQSITVRGASSSCLFSPAGLIEVLPSATTVSQSSYVAPTRLLRGLWDPVLVGLDMHREHERVVSCFLPG